MVGESVARAMASTAEAATSVTAPLDGMATSLGRFDSLAPSVQQAITEAMRASGAAVTETTTAMRNGFQQAIAPVTDLADTISGSLDAALQSANISTEELTTTLRSAGVPVGIGGIGMETPSVATSGIGIESATAPGVGAAWGALSGHFSGIGQSLMTTAMGGWMASMGAGMLANSAMSFANIQSVMQSTNGTPAQAERLIGELGVGGINSSAVPQFLAGLSGNLQQLFQPNPNSGQLSKTALMLEGYGLGPSIQTETSGQQLQTIQKQFATLTAQGRGSQAQSMLGLLGMSQLTPLMSNWSAVQKQFQGFSLGMNSKQISQGATAGISAQASLQKLSLQFSTLAEKLVPAMTSVVNAMTGVISAFTSGKGPINSVGSAVSALTTALGPWWTSLLAVGVAIKAMQIATATAKLVRDFTALAKAIGAGAIQVGTQVAAWTARQAIALGQWIASMAASVAAWVAAVAADAAEMVAGVATAIAPLAVAALPFVLAAAAIAAAVVLVVEAIKHWSAITSAAGQVVAWVTSAAQSVWGAIKSFGEQFIGAISNLVSYIRSAIASFMGGIETGIGGVASGVSIAGVHPLGGIGSSLTTAGAQQDFMAQMILATRGQNLAGPSSTMQTQVGNTTINISLPVMASSTDRAFAQNVAKELATSLKLRGNVDLSY